MASSSNIFLITLDGNLLYVKFDTLSNLLGRRLTSNLDLQASNGLQEDYSKIWIWLVTIAPIFLALKNTKTSNHYELLSLMNLSDRILLISPCSWEKYKTHSYSEE